MCKGTPASHVAAKFGGGAKSAALSFLTGKPAQLHSGSIFLPILPCAEPDLTFTSFTGCVHVAVSSGAAWPVLHLLGHSIPCQAAALWSAVAA